MKATRLESKIRKGLFGLFCGMSSRLTVEKLLTFIVIELEEKVKNGDERFIAPNIFHIMVNGTMMDTLEEKDITGTLESKLASYAYLKGYEFEDDIFIKFIPVSFIGKRMVQVFCHFSEKEDFNLKLRLNGEEIGKYKLNKNAKYVLGREKDCDVVIADPMVSKKHIKVFIDSASNLFIKDLNSKNGTVINGLQLIPGFYRKIARGNIIALGKFNNVLLEVV